MSKGKSLHKVPRFPAKKSPSSSAVSLLSSSDDSHKNVQTNVHNDETDDLGDIHKKNRIQIKNWLSAQTDTQLREIKEHKDYKIMLNDALTVLALQRQFFACIVRLIHVKNGSVKVSNWSRHIKDHM